MIVQPSSQTVEVMQSAIFTTEVGGIGDESFTYQWQHNGEDLNGETRNTLNLESVTRKDKGTYSCIVKNLDGDSDAFSAKLIILSECMSILLQYIIVKIVLRPYSAMVVCCRKN